MKIGIVGYGYVGQAIAELMSRHELVINDPSKGSRGDVSQCDFVFVCVPTPMAPDGSCDTSIVEGVVKSIGPHPIIIIKSTVAPDTTMRLEAENDVKVVFSPEYAGESSYWSSHAFHRKMVETPFFVFGGPKDLTAECVDLFLPICGPEKRYIQTSATAAELAKYAENSFYALKIMFCYEFAKICQAHAEDWNEVREIWLADPRINQMHTAVFAENKQAFGGKCLPKDLSAIIHSASAYGHDAKLLAEVKRINDEMGRT